MGLVKKICSGNVPIYMQELNLFVLMNANDMVIFPENIHELQEMSSILFMLILLLGTLLLMLQRQNCYFYKWGKH